MRNCLHPRHRDQAPAIRTTHAVRLGLRQIKGFREADAALLVAARATPFTSVRDLWLRSGFRAPRSSGSPRRTPSARSASTAARRSGRCGRSTRSPPPSACRSSPPPATSTDLQREEQVALPEMPPGEHVVSDYRSLSLSLKAHPVSFLRRELAAAGIVEAGAACGDAQRPSASPSPASSLSASARAPHRA